MRLNLLIFILLTALGYAQQGNDLISGDVCDIAVYGDLIKIPESELTSEQCFDIGKCEFNGKHYKEAYRFFEMAGSKGFEDSVLLEFYINESLLALGKQQVYLYKDSLANSEGSPEAHDHIRVGVQTYLNHLLDIGILNKFFLVCGILVLVLAGMILYSFGNKNPATWFFGMFLVCMSQFIIEWDLRWVRDVEYFFTDPFYRVSFFLWGPVFYLYIKRSFHPGRSLKVFKSDIIIHTAVFLFLTILYVSCRIFPAVDVLNWPHELFRSFLFKTGHMIFYFLMTVRLVAVNYGKLSNIHKRWFLSLGVFFTVMSVAMVYVFLYEDDYSILYESRLFFALIFCVLGLFVWGSFLIQPRVFLQLGLRVLSRQDDPSRIKNVNKEPDHLIDAKKYRNSGLTESLIRKLRSDLLRVMEEDKLFLDHDLNLESLARSLDSDRYSVSQVINQEFGKSFYEFINDYRVDEVVRIIQEEGKKRKLVDIAFLAGFNNRVSFNKAFKSRKGVTPSSYLHQVTSVA